jgi:SAM-dependent methyltransferase
MKQRPLAVSQKSVSDFLSTVAIEDDQVDGEILKDSPRELEEYRFSHAARLLHGLLLVQKWSAQSDSLRILELGAAPYYFTALLQRYIRSQVTGVSVQAATWPGAEAVISTQEVRLKYGSPASMSTLPVYVFNIEKDLFPFPDASFDMIIGMEIIEHLGYSPTHMLAESHRVLRPGGRLIISTPNAVDMRKTVGPLLNRSVGFPYSGYGIYGRHQREFTMPELRHLVEACGYIVLDTHQANLHVRTNYLPALRAVFGLLNFFSGLPLPYFRNKRETLFLVAESTGRPKWGYPPNLYLFPHLYQNPAR